MPGLKIREVDGAVIFTAKVVPGSSRTVVSGLLNGMIKIKISAAPEKGKANQCLIGFLSEQIGLRKSDIAVVAGLTRPIKDVRVQGISAEALLEKLGMKKVRIDD